MSAITSFTEDYFFLSTFFRCKVVCRIPGLCGLQVCRSVEHAYQAHKPKDPILKLKILRAQSPGVAKKWGNQVRLESILNWDRGRDALMLRLLRCKFDPKVNPGLVTSLLHTGSVPLVEGNNWGDTYWGIVNNTGENRLGQLLMYVREELRNKK